MHNYFFKIEVVGRGRFPLDQLRRFEMFPIDIDTPVLIEASFNGDLATRTFTLGMYASSLGADGSCIARFASFGFHAEALEVWKDDKLMYQNGEPYCELEPATDQTLCRECDAECDESELSHGACLTCHEKGFV